MVRVHSRGGGWLTLVANQISKWLGLGQEVKLLWGSLRLGLGSVSGPGCSPVRHERS